MPQCAVQPSTRIFEHAVLHPRADPSEIETDLLCSENSVAAVADACPSSTDYRCEVRSIRLGPVTVNRPLNV